jgi:hypothetical protein
MSTTMTTARQGTLPQLVELLAGDQLQPHELQAALGNLTARLTMLSDAHIAHLSAHLSAVPAGAADVYLPG